MNPRLLIVVTGDPRTSKRPAEAVRIAAGVCAWKRVDVSLFLRGPAILALGEFAGELAELGETPVTFQLATDGKLASLAAESDCVLRF